MRALILVVPFLLMACTDDLTKTNQDPLTGKPERIRNATPPTEKASEKHEAISVDALVLTMEPGIANFTEGVEGQVKFVGRAVGAKLDSEIVFENLPPGATFDPLTGVFNWEPSESFLAGVSYHKDYILEAMIKTRLPDSGAIVARQVSFTLNVYRNLVAPIVQPVTGLADVKEGTRANFTVLVEDEDSVDGNITPLKVPSLVVVPSQNIARDASAHVQFESSTASSPNPQQDAVNPKIWKYRLYVDLSQKEVTPTTKVMEFGVKATSGFGLPSAAKFVTFNAVTNISRPVSTLENRNIQAVVGFPNTVYFTVYSPRGDGTLVTDFSAIEAIGARVTCSSPTGNTALKNCRMSWTPGTLTTPMNLKFKAINKHLDGVSEDSIDFTNTFQAISPSASFVE